MNESASILYQILEELKSINQKLDAATPSSEIQRILTSYNENYSSFEK